jgi:DNA-binding NarL/FixJ family response regulator
MGVKGYLSKEAPKEEILHAIQTVLDDKLFISEKVMLRFSEFVLDKMPDNVFESLSVRELEVTRHLCKGLRLNEICELMNLHPSTIGTHKARIFEKLGVKNNIELKELAQLNNIIF